MKITGVLAASVAAVATAASSAALPASSTEARDVGGSGSRRGGGEKEKFAPRFDGLRFIETLVTAHR